MDYIPPAIYFVISILGFYFSWKGFTKKDVMFKKGVKGTPLDKNQKLALAHALLLFALSMASFGYAVIWVELLLR